MEKLIVRLKSHAKIEVFCNDGIAWELREAFSFFVNGYKFMPKYRAKVWDGKIRIFDYNRRELPAGLFEELVKFCKNRDYELILEDSPFGKPGAKNKLDPKEVWKFIESLNITSSGKPITVRDYQFNAICKAIEDKRGLMLSPTGSGKSLVAYILIRWHLAKKYNPEAAKILLVVPTTSLVEQMYSDFADYSSQDPDWNVKNYCHKIYSGKEKVNVHEDVFISTWQSIYKLPQTWFEQFGTIIGDEAHLFTANSLTKSMDKAVNASHRLGMTGTLDGTKTNELVLTGVFGKVYRATTTKKLQDRGELAPLIIYRVIFEWPEEIRSQFARTKYHDEIQWIIANEQRNKYISKLAVSLEGNSLVLFNHIDKHGKILYDMIKDINKNRTFYVSGETDT